MSSLFQWIEGSGAGFILEIGIQSLVLFGLAFLAAIALKRSPAWTRHTLWVGTFLALLLIPFGHGFLPRFGVLPAATTPETTLDRSPGIDASKSTLFGERDNRALATPKAPKAEGIAKPTKPSLHQPKAEFAAVRENEAAPTGDEATVAAPPLTWRAPLFALWCAGFAFFMGRFIFAIFRLRAWRLEADPVQPNLRLLAAQVCKRAGLSSPAKIVMTDRVRGPALAGLWHPTFLVPHTVAHQGSKKIVHSLLLHEAMHIKQRDPQVQAFVTLMCGVFWFNPLVFLGARLLAKEREVLTDAAVVRQLDRSSDYAQGIVDVMRSRNQGHQSTLALGVADGTNSEIENRLELIIAGGGAAWRKPTRLGRLSSIVAILVLATLSMSIGLEPSAAAPSARVAADADETAATVADVLLVVDLPEPIPSAGESTMIDWPSWRRARAGSYVFEGRPMSVENIEERLAAYGVKNKSMRETNRPHVAKTTLHLRVHKRRPFRDVARVLMIAVRNNIAIYKIDMAQGGAPELRFKIALPIDRGFSSQRINRTIVVGVSNETKSGTEYIRVAVNGRRIPLTRDLNLLAMRLEELVKIPLQKTSTSLVLDVDGEVEFSSLSNILESVLTDQRTTIGFGKKEALEETADLPIGHGDVEEAEFIAPRLAALKIQGSIEKGLGWLSRQQADDGSISVTPTKDRGLELGRTALATMAFMGFGHTHKSGPYQEVVKKAIDRLSANLSQPDPKYPCCLAPIRSAYRNYSHAIATLALAEAYSLTKDPTLKPPIETAIKYILQAQNPYRGWRYSVCDGQNDTSMTAWMLMALNAANKAGIKVEKRRIEWGLDYIRSVTDPESGRIGYLRAGESPVREVSKRLLHPPQLSESLTAMGLTIKSILVPDAYQKDINQLGLNLLDVKYPLWSKKPETFDYVYGLFGALAVNSKDVSFKDSWHSVLISTLVENQVKKGEIAGSWPTKSPWGEVGGPVYTTAMAVLSLEIATGVK
ncbi:MAG: beta-lactamase regulating signal transducer with metallopeptidase domain [Planctomycetota bacterium]|jgi:beta-lactamase regulating signal transducer with metallopeptidase domain